MSSSSVLDTSGTGVRLESADTATSSTAAATVATQQVCVRPPSFLLNPLLTSSSRVSHALFARFSPSLPTASHLVSIRGGDSLLTQPVQLTQTQSDDESTAQVNIQHDSIPSQPLLGSIMQLATFATASVELLLATSTSGHLSLLSFSSPTPAAAPRLRPVAHVRIGSSIRGSSWLSSGRRCMGAYLRVESQQRAIAVASLEAVGPHKKRANLTEKKEASEEEDVIPEGGVLVYPIAAAPAAPASSSSSTAAAAANHSVLPNLQSPIPIAFHGNITAIQFLPSLREGFVRMFVAVTPHLDSVNSMSLLMKANVDALKPGSYQTSSAASSSSISAQQRSELVLLEINLRDLSYSRKDYPLQLQAGEVIREIVLVNPSHYNYANATPLPCFVLLQLDNRVIMVDCDSHSPLLFPISIPTPTDSSSASPSRLSCWNWVGGRSNEIHNNNKRLVCVNQTGEVYQLHLWWNLSPTSLPASQTATDWIRFISLGEANPASIMVTISTPPFLGESPMELTSASTAMHAPIDFLLLFGGESDHMIARIDWAGPQEKLRQQLAVERGGDGSALRDSAMQTDSTSSSTTASFPSCLQPLDSALYRQAATLSNLSELHEFVSLNATLTQPFPSASPQIFALCGKGSSSTLRVIRPNSIQAEIQSSMPTEQKVFRSVISLMVKQQAVALISCFHGSTRIGAVRDGDLEDISEEMAHCGFELNRTTLAAALAFQGQILLQVTDQTIVASRVVASGPNEQWALQKCVASWSRGTNVSQSASGGGFTVAHIYSNFIFLFHPATHTLLLLQLQFNPATNQAQFVLVAEKTDIHTDVSCLLVAPFRLTNNSAIDASDLILFVGTHDAQLQVFKLAPAAAAMNAAGTFVLFHTVSLSQLLTSLTGIESDTPAVAESILLCSTLPSLSSSALNAPSPSANARFHLYIGFREGTLLRCAFHPLAQQASDIFKHSYVRRLGVQPVKLIRVDENESNHDSNHLLALTDHTYLIASHLSSSEGVNDSRTLRLYTREIVWKWNAANSVNTRFQFATPFPGADNPNVLACVIDGGFHLIELDINQPQHALVASFPLPNTPRRIAYHAPSGLFVILTHERQPNGKFVSQLLLVHPLTGQIVDRFTPAGSATGVTEALLALTIWNHWQHNTYVIAVGGTEKNATAYTLMIDAASAAMDCSDSDASTPTGSHRFRLVHHLVNSLQGSIATAVIPQSGNILLIAFGDRIAALFLKRAAVKQTPAVAASASSASVADASSTVETDVLKPVLITRSHPVAPYPVRSMSACENPYDSKSPFVAMMDEKHGVVMMDIANNPTLKKMTATVQATDPFARLGRQVHLFQSLAALVPSTAVSASSPAHHLPLKHIKLFQPQSGRRMQQQSAASTSSSSSSSSNAVATTTLVTRSLGYDLFGNIFLLRKEPQLFPAPASSSTSATAGVTASPHVPTSSTTTSTSSTSSSSSVTAVPHKPENVILGLVQESSFQLPTLPSCIRQVRMNEDLASDKWNTEEKSQRLPKSDSDAFLISTRAGAFYLLRELTAENASWLYPLQAALNQSPFTRSMLANHQPSYRGGGVSPIQQTEQFLDGVVLTSFFLLTIDQQQQLCSSILSLKDVPLAKINAQLQLLLEL